jgi:hypothetical protein
MNNFKKKTQVLLNWIIGFLLWFTMPQNEQDFGLYPKEENRELIAQKMW